MPDQVNAKRIVAPVMMVSAAVFFLVAVLIYAGTIPVGPELRVTAAIVVGVVAFSDFLIGLWFFRMGQSS